MLFSLRVLAHFACFLLGNSCVVAIADGDAAWVEWDRTSDHVVSRPEDKGAGYPRCKQLSNGEFLLSYHHGEALGHFGSRITVRLSRDDAKTWYSSKELDGPEPNDFWGFTNPDFIELDKGVVLLASAARGRAEPGQNVYLSESRRSELRLRISTDFGNSWGPPLTVARGRGRLWEPCLVKLPKNVVELYYANESPELASGENLKQRIEMIRSTDNAATWSDPVIVSYRDGMRNGMPSAVVLKNGQVAVAEEIVGDPISPWIFRTSKGRPVQRGDYPCQNAYGFGGAPFLAIAKQGSTLLAYHTGHNKQPAPESAKVPWMFSNIVVQPGNADASAFGVGSFPWPNLDGRTGSFYPAITIKSPNTVIVLASFITQAADGSSRSEVRSIEGALKAASRRK